MKQTLLIVDLDSISATSGRGATRSVNNFLIWRPETVGSCIPPFAAVTLTLENGAFSTAWRRAMATGFLGLFYLTFLPVVFFPGGDPLMPKSPKTISM